MTRSWAFALLITLGTVLAATEIGQADEGPRDPSAVQAFVLAGGDRQPVLIGAASFLRDGIRRCTGTELRTVPESQYVPRRDGPAIFVGDTAKARELLGNELPQLDAEGYIILVQPELVVIYAPPATTDSGEPLTWAQGDFLRRFMGVDWYLPGPIGEEYPQQKRVLIPCGKWIENPAFKHRHWSGYAGKASSAWRVRSSGGGGRFRFHHNLHRIIDPEKFADQPELFPMIDGQRVIPTRTVAWQPCTTNPNVLRITVETIDRFLAANPNVGSFSLGVNDSKGYCQCPQCLAQTPPGLDANSAAARGYRFYELYNQVARATQARHPGVRLGLLVYEDLAAYEPQHLEPALMPYLTMSMADCWDPAYKQRLHERMTRWGSIATHWGLYEYLYGQGFLIPRLYLRELAQGLRVAHAHGADGFYAEAYPNWALDGPKLWVLERLLWDPQQDVDVLMDQWCRGMFRDAAAPMRKYFDQLEKIWAEQKPTDAKRGGYRLWGVDQRARQFTEIFPPARCDEAWRWLEAARKSTSDPRVLERIDYFQAGFGLTRLAAARHTLATQLRTLSSQQPKPTPAEWLVALNPLVQLPTLSQYLTDHRAAMPLGLQEFTTPQTPAEQLRELLAWESQSPELEQLAGRLASDTLKSSTSRPTDKPAFDAAMDHTLNQLAKEAQQRGKITEAVRTLQPMLHDLSLVGTDCKRPPKLDGNVTENWGTPSFDGHFRLYNQSHAAPERTRLWVLRNGPRLLVAFDCEQPGSSIKATAIGHDQVKLNPQGVVQPGDNAADFPYFRQADAVGVRLPDGRIAIVTAGGGVFDAEPSAQGYRTQWDGVTAAVSRDQRGWSATLAIEYPGMGDGPGPVEGLNFFRVVNGVRSTWVPAPPRVWSIDPRSSGYLFFNRVAGE